MSVAWCFGYFLTSPLTRTREWFLQFPFFRRTFMSLRYKIIEIPAQEKNEETVCAGSFSCRSMVRYIQGL
jgi:hypothetical protein